MVYHSTGGQLSFLRILSLVGQEIAFGSLLGAVRSSCFGKSGAFTWFHIFINRVL